MKFRLASELQRRFVESPPSGWVAKREVGLLSPEITRVLGYRPCADLLLESQAAAQRIWVEFEISRADPVANHTKFASAHLIDPLPSGDVFVSLVSNDIARGRANLGAHAIFLLRLAGLHAFQMPLFPSLDAGTIKKLNQGCIGLDAMPDPDMVEVIELTRPVGRAPAASRIYYATNRLEVLLNLHQWNSDMAQPALREQWGQRKIRYLVADPCTGLFAPAKFCAYTRMPCPFAKPEVATPCMTVPAYVAIPQADTIFDGQKARLRIERIGLRSVRLDHAPQSLVRSFAKWHSANRESVKVALEACVLLCP